MNMDSNWPLPYEVKETKDLYYTFLNKDGIVYHIYFTPLFPVYPDLVNTYSFSIEPEDKMPHAIDRRIAITVITVLKRFFANVENAMIMVCDSTDGKQQKRRDLFNRWFRIYNDGSMETRNAEIGDGNYELLLSIYFKKDNPCRKQLVKAFNELLTNELYEIVI